METNATETISPGCKAIPRTPNHGHSLAPEEVQQFILNNLPEVRYIARHIHSRLPPHVPFDDLVQAGVLGLMDAVEKFDRSKTVQLMSYARYRIRGAILDSLRELDWGPRRLRKQAREIEQAHRDLLAKLGRVPLESEVAAQLGLPPSALQHILAELQSLTVEPLQVGRKFNSPGEARAAQPRRSGDDPFELCVRLETSKLLTEAMDSLEEKERRALTLYYFEDRTMKEVGKALDVCESRVSQIISGALHGLRERLQEPLKIQGENAG
jgi:RNA polymerase sigma factor for flagellar operon FliA